MGEATNTQDKAVSENLAPVIAAVAERIHYAESRRTNYTVMAAALIAAGLTILTFAAGFDGQEWLRDGAFIGSLGLLITGVLVIHKYGRQTNRYPYTRATKTWKWFYRDALPNAEAFDLVWWKGWKRQSKRVQSAYTEQLPTFKDRLRKLESERLNLDQDLEQLYSLHINEKYKNIHLSTLRTVFNCGLAFTILFVFLAGCYGYYSQIRFAQPVTENLANSTWALSAEYRPISSSLSQTADLEAKVLITNRSSAPITLSRFIMKSARGWVIPADIAILEPKLPIKIAAKSSVTVFADIKVARSYYEQQVTLAPVVQ